VWLCWPKRLRQDNHYENVAWVSLHRPLGKGHILGEPIEHPEKYLSRVGAMIEGPAFYPALSGHENLMVLARLGGFPIERVQTLLEKVGLR
jgi:ABC-type multidrug transport system ATPase subunit